MMLGIDISDGLIFEGRSKYGAHLVWPLPVMTPARFAKASDGDFDRTTLSGPSNFYFREDFFDPISRIRRGRFYKYTGTLDSWDVLRNPNVYFNSGADWLVRKSLAEYQPFSFCHENIGAISTTQMLVMMGAETASTIWVVINVETILTGEELVTLKARQSFGVLPEILWGVIPDSGLDNIREALQTLDDDFHIASPESVVDRANEAATRILNVYLEIKNKGTQDSLNKAIVELGKLEKEDKKEVARDAADIVRLLHGRTKYAVQKTHNVRPIREQDAELSVQCIGVMLCDLGWAKWN
jgi:hypothetical protein